MGTISDVDLGFEGSVSNVDLPLALHTSSTPDFNLVQVLVQDLILQSLIKVRTPLEDVRRYYVQCIYI